MSSESNTDINPSWNWDHPLYLRCDCHQPHHAVIIERDKDFSDTVMVSVVSTKSSGFFHRVYWAMRHIFAGEHLTVGDVLLDRDATLRLRDFCNAILKAEGRTPSKTANPGDVNEQ
jgi:hypothetical protein